MSCVTGMILNEIYAWLEIDSVSMAMASPYAPPRRERLG